MKLKPFKWRWKFLKTWFERSYVMRVICVWLQNILISFDQLANTFIGGSPDETISSRLGKGRRAGSVLATIGCIGVNLIFFWQEDHCEWAIEEDEGNNSVNAIMRDWYAAHHTSKGTTPS